MKRKQIYIILFSILIILFLYATKLYSITKKGYSLKASFIIIINNIDSIIKKVDFHKETEMFITSKSFNKNKLLLILNNKYFIPTNINRYLSIKTNNLNKEMQYINMSLDYPFYTNIKIVTNPYDKSVLINKYYSLPKNIIYNDLEPIKENIYLRKEAKDALTSLINEATKNNLTINIISGYRTKEYQENLYNNYLKTSGKTYADNFSARPNHSEHQTGLSVDLSDHTNIIESFYNTNQYIWITQNAHNYGFILRYPQNKELITGYNFEPWHYRYVGKIIATKIYKNNITLEEYYSLPS